MIWAIVAFAAEPPAHPDLSGTWTAVPRTVDPDKPRRGDSGTGWTSPFTLAQDAAGLGLEYAFFTPGELQGPLRFRFAFDGAETHTVVYMGHGPQDLRSTARWDADRLVIVTAYPLVDPATGAVLSVDVTRTLSLPAPSTLVIETVRAGVLGGRQTSSRVEYTKTP